MAYIKFSVDPDWIPHFKNWFNTQNYPSLKINIYENQASSEEEPSYQLIDKCFTTKGLVVYDTINQIPTGNISSLRGAVAENKDKAYVGWKFNLAWNEIGFLLYPLNPVESSEGLIDSPDIYLWLLGNRDSKTVFDSVDDLQNDPMIDLENLKIEIEFPHNEYDKEFFIAADKYHRDYHYDLEYEVLLDNYFITVEEKTRLATPQQIELPIYNDVVWSGYGNFANGIEPRYQKYFIIINNWALNYRRAISGEDPSRSIGELQLSRFPGLSNSSDLMFNYLNLSEDGLNPFIDPITSDAVYISPLEEDSGDWALDLFCVVDENDFSTGTCIWSVDNGTSETTLPSSTNLKPGNYRISVIGVNYNSESLPNFLISKYNPETNGK